MKEELNENQKLIIQVLEHFEFCKAYWGIEMDTDLPHDVVVKEVQALKAMGLVKHVRGLMDDDGKVAGSGFDLTPEGREMQIKINGHD